jgi:sugar phosphate isomerase/epimerase
MIYGGLVSITFRKLSVEEIVALVKKSGLSGIEWGGDVHVPVGYIEEAERVCALTESAGLKVAAYGSYYRAGVSENEGMEFASVLETAVALGAPVIRVWAGNKASDDIAREERNAIVDDLKRICNMAEEKAIGVSCEYHCNTLTDTTESAVRLLEELKGSNVKFYWQPPNGQSLEYCFDGFEKVAENVTNIHTFHWAVEDGKNIRKPLADGRGLWIKYLALAAKIEGERFALIEFVENDEPDNFIADAKILKSWLDKVNNQA